MSLKCLCLSVACLLLTSAVAVSAQEPAGGTKEAAPAALPLTTTLPKNYPVVSMTTACPKSAAKRGCSTVVTRDEFEALVNAMNPRMIKPERHELAENYGRVLALSQLALKKGLDRDPHVQAQLRYQRLHALASAMAREIYKDTLASPSEDAEKYYAAHKSAFERFNFERLYIPKQKRTEVAKASDLESAVQQANADQPDKQMTALAEQVYARAQAGEDFAKLQKEVFQQAGIETDPNVKVDDIRRGDFSDAQAVAFDLTPGKMTPVIADYNGYFIYKLVSRTVPPFEEVRPQVTVRMQNDKSTQAVKNIEKLYNAKVNNAYFEKYDPPPPSDNEPELDTD